MKEENKTAGLVLGILSIVLGTISFFVFWWLSIFGIGLGSLGVNISSSKTLNIVGICLSTVALFLVIIMFVIARCMI